MLFASCRIGRKAVTWSPRAPASLTLLSITAPTHSPLPAPRAWACCSFLLAKMCLRSAGAATELRRAAVSRALVARDLQGRARLAIDDVPQRQSSCQPREIPRRAAAAPRRQRRAAVHLHALRARQPAPSAVPAAARLAAGQQSGLYKGPVSHSSFDSFLRATTRLQERRGRVYLVTRPNRPFPFLSPSWTPLHLPQDDKF
eukprot:6176973-Pleurochrysis_carterae.AAC.4